MKFVNEFKRILAKKRPRLIVYIGNSKEKLFKTINESLSKEYTLKATHPGKFVVFYKDKPILSFLYIGERHSSTAMRGFIPDYIFVDLNINNNKDIQTEVVSSMLDGLKEVVSSEKISRLETEGFVKTQTKEGFFKYKLKGE